MQLACMISQSHVCCTGTRQSVIICILQYIETFDVGQHTAYSMTEQAQQSTVSSVVKAKRKPRHFTFNTADVLILACWSVPNQALALHTAIYTVTAHVPTLLQYTALLHV